MLQKLFKFISKIHEILISKILPTVIILIILSCPAFARNDSVNFTDSSGEEHAKDSEQHDVPYVPTPMKVVRSLLNLCMIGRNDFLIDLGSGDGRIVITAAKEYGARGFGVDLNEKLVELSKKYAIAEGVEKQTDFLVQDIFKTDIRKATVVTMYLLNDINLKLRPKLLNELKPGTRIVSHDFHMGSWMPDKMVLLDVPKFYQDDTILYLWIVPARVAGKWQWQLKLRDKEQAFDLDLNQNFQNINGAVYNQGKKMPILNPSLEGDLIRFSLVSDADERMIRQDYIGRVQGNIIKGNVRLSGTIKNTVMEWEAMYAWRLLPEGFSSVEGQSN